MGILNRIGVVCQWARQRAQRRVASYGWLAARAALLGALLYALATPPPVLVTLGEQHQVQTTNPKLGVHTRLTDEVEEWKIKKTLELVREMGAPWIVEYFPWEYLEPNEGEYDWGHADLVVDHARRQGLTVIARLGFVPAWARPKKSAPGYLDEAYYPQFALFVAEFARHFAGRVEQIIIWNEPNLNFEWGYRGIDPGGYARMLQAVYPRAKDANPSAQILAGALAPTLAPPGTADAMNDLDYLQALYDAGAKEYFDALAIHAYGWTSAADEAPARNRINFRRTEILREIMIRNGDAAKRALITEGGWNDHPRWTKAVTPAQRVAYTVRAYEIAQTWDWLDACALWAFRYPFASQTYLDYFAFVTPDFDPKPIYYEVQKYATSH